MYATLKITIVECMIEYYGKDCSNKCSTTCNVAERCDKITGRCDGGCKPGWTGNTCDQMKSVNIYFFFYPKLNILSHYDSNYVVKNH